MLEAHGLEVRLGDGAEQRFNLVAQKFQFLWLQSDPEVFLVDPVERGGRLLDHNRGCGNS